MGSTTAILTHDAEKAAMLAEAMHDWLRRGGFPPIIEQPEPGYQGWKNYETWCVHLWLTGDQPLDCQCMKIARHAIALAPHCGQIQEGSWRVEEAPRLLLADQLKELLDSGSPLRDAASVYSDLLGSAMYEVDWYEVAEAFLERASG